jgi:hypothetical protein
VLLSLISANHAPHVCRLPPVQVCVIRPLCLTELITDYLRYLNVCESPLILWNSA